MEKEEIKNIKRHTTREIIIKMQMSRLRIGLARLLWKLTNFPISFHLLGVAVRCFKGAISRIKERPRAMIIIN